MEVGLDGLLSVGHTATSPGARDLRLMYNKAGNAEFRSNQTCLDGFVFLFPDITEHLFHFLILAFLYF